MIHVALPLGVPCFQTLYIPFNVCPISSVDDFSMVGFWFCHVATLSSEVFVFTIMIRIEVRVYSAVDRSIGTVHLV